MVVFIGSTQAGLTLLPSPLLGNALQHPVAKLVKSFGRLVDTAESLDDFRYANPSL